MRRASVRTHIRRIPGVGTVTVHRHDRTQKNGRGQRKRRTRERGLFRPHRAGRNLKRAFKSARRHKKAAAVTCLSLGSAELAAWVGLRGLTATATMVGVAAFAVGVETFKAARAARPAHPGWVNGGDR